MIRPNDFAPRPAAKPKPAADDTPEPPENPPPAEQPKKKKKCHWGCWVSDTFSKGANWVDDHKAQIAGAVVGGVVGIGCAAAIGVTGIGAVACGAAAGAVSSMVEYSISTAVEHKGNFSWGGLAENAAIGAVVGGLMGGVMSVGGAGVQAGARSLLAGSGARAAASAGKAAVKKEASNIASGLTRNGFGKSAAKAAEGADTGAPKGGSCPKTHSFAGATLVLMADGTTKPISKVKAGDKVTATDPATGKHYKKTIQKVHINHDTALTDLKVEINGKTSVLRTTQHHPFWDQTAERWVDASDLDKGDTLRTQGTAGPEVIRAANYVGARTMYDLTVDTIHTYYVLAGKTPVLVHNCPTGGSGGVSHWSARSENAGDLSKNYTPGQSTRDPASQWYHEMLSNDELLDGINKAAQGDGIVVSRGGTILGGHHRWDELQTRIADNRIDPSIKIRIDVYDGE